MRLTKNSRPRLPFFGGGERGARRYFHLNCHLACGFPVFFIHSEFIDEILPSRYSRRKFPPNIGKDPIDSLDDDDENDGDGDGDDDNQASKRLAPEDKLRALAIVPLSPVV